MADVADQDADKARTYDHCRVEYAHLDTVMYIDTDELLFCPQVMKLPPSPPVPTPTIGLMYYLP